MIEIDQIGSLNLSSPRSAGATKDRIMSSSTNPLAGVTMAQLVEALQARLQGEPGARGPSGPAGTAGAAGISIQSAVVNAAGHLILTLTNGSTTDAGDVVGPQGATGAQGVPGVSSTATASTGSGTASGSGGTTSGTGTTTAPPVLVLATTATSNGGTAIWFHGDWQTGNPTSIDASADGGKTWPYTGSIRNEGGGWDAWWYNAPAGTYTPMIRATADHAAAVTAANSVTITAATSAPTSAPPTTGGTTSSGGTGTTTGGTTTVPTGNPEGLTLSIPPGTFAFSNIPPGNNTICIVRPANNKDQYLAWSILKSSVPLTIDYAGYVQCTDAPGAGPITATVQGIDVSGNSVATLDISIPVVQTGAQVATRAPGSYSGLPTTGLVVNKKFLSTGLVGFNIANNTAATLGAGYVRFLQPFVAGAIPKGGVPISSVPIQSDTINTYADGSIKTALITVDQAALAVGASAQYALASGTPGKQAPIDLAAALTAAKYALVFDIQMLDNSGADLGSPVSIDLVAAMQAAIIGKAASYFQAGPLVTQARLVVPVSGSLYLNVDISAFADGSIRSDVSVRNDIAMSASGGPIYSTGTITQNGTSVYAWKELYQTQYQAWFFECGTTARYAGSVQLDPAYLVKAAVIQPYNLGIGVDAAAIGGYVAIAGDPNWLAPLNPNNVDTGMPGTGGRPDIGYLTQSATVAAITQDPRAIDYCCAQADASGSAPWNYYDAANGCFVSTVNYPDIWFDQSNRGGVGTPGLSTSGGATQPVTGNPQSWSLDQAHQPDLSFVPWLYTGRRVYLDQVMMQGAWSITGQYNRSMTIPGTSTVIAQSLWGGQVRGIAWTIRQVSNAAYFAPDGSSYATYFPAMLAENAAYGAGLQTYLQSLQGSCWGYIEQLHGGASFAPWEQNYLQPICALAGARGYPGWTPVSNWFARFTVESFTAQTDGPCKGANWNQRNGASYELFTGLSTSNQSGTAPVYTAQTWAELEYWTAISGQSNGGETYDAATDTIIAGTPDWSHSAGDYGQLCGATLVWAQINGVSGATDAAAWLAASGAPYTDVGSLQADPTFSLKG